jgi:RNA polymerase sigma-70 factor, ECF subfamily
LFHHETPRLAGWEIVLGTPSTLPVPAFGVDGVPYRDRRCRASIAGFLAPRGSAGPVSAIGRRCTVAPMVGHACLAEHASMAQLATRRPPDAPGTALDVESAGWLHALSSVGAERDDAVRRLHALLLRAARFEVTRRQRTAGPGSGSRDLDDLAVQAADDALVAILRKLHTFRGDSRFTTWAYKFALLEAAAKLRGRPWQAREVPLDDDGWAQLLDDRHAAPEAQAETCELIGAVRDAIAEVLTSRQRAVLVAITLNDVPIDVLAERQNTTRGALYKTLHDARRKLRARLAQDGLATALPPARSQP